MAVKIEQSNVLVVEGKDEKLFFGAFIKHLELQNIQIFPIGGKDQLRRNLKALVSSPGFSGVIALGIVRDADTNPTAAFQSVRDALQAVKLPAPKHPFTPFGHNPRVAIMILPKKDAPGMLENLCLESVSEDPAMPCVEQYFECLQQNGLYLPSNKAKAKVQVFLASRPKAGLRLGEAAQVGYWPWEEAPLKYLGDFLHQFYKEGK